MNGKRGRVSEFLTVGIWKCNLRTMSMWKRRGIMMLRILILLVRNIKSARSHLWASALTYYSMFTIVPIVALGVGVAKGFGLDDKMRDYVREQLSNNPDVADYLLQFADRTLEHASYGLVAGVGVLLLLFAVVRMIGNIEGAFNFVYGVRNNRPFLRKLSYYMSLLLVVPVVIIAAGSASALTTNAMTAFAAQFETLPTGFTRIGVRLLGFPIVWLVFMVIYKFLPNTKVKLVPALWGAVVAGTLYQLLQMGFVWAQFALSKYNAIYGSFSALPLFMIYLQFSWLIVLLGIQICFVSQNADNIDAAPGGTRLSGKYRRTILLIFTGLAFKRMLDHRPAPTAEEFGRIFWLPPRIVNSALEVLTAAGVLAEVTAGEGRGGYVPVLPQEELTAAGVIEKCENLDYGFPTYPEGPMVDNVLTLLEKFTAEAQDSSLRVSLSKIPD